MTVTSTTKRSCEIKLLRSYQRGLLLGAGVLLSLALAFGACLAIRSEIQDYIAEGRAVYVANKARITQIIEKKQAAMRRGIIHSELIWRTIGSQRPAADFRRGRLLIQTHPLLIPQLALGAVTPQRTARSFSRWLAFSEARAYAVTANARERGDSFAGYFYDPEHTFLSVAWPPISRSLFKDVGARDVPALIARLAPDIGDLDDPAYLDWLHKTRHVFWLPPAPGPFTGEMVLQVVEPGFDGDRPFAVFVSNLSFDMLHQWLRRSTYDGNFMIVDGNGKLILSSWDREAVDPGLAAKVLESGVWRENLDSSDYVYRGGAFVISEPLADTGWVFAYAYSWRTILAARGSFIATCAGGALLMIALLWMLIYFYFKKVLSPLLLRSQQVLQSLREARGAAEAANQAKSVFLASMSHEIRTPLNGILGNLELLAHTPLTELQRDRLQMVSGSSRALLDIISDILDFSKIESGQMRMEQIPFDVVDLVEQAIAIFVPAADNKGLDLFYRITPQLPHCQVGDPTRLRQVIVNLLSNAIKFTAHGEVRVELTPLQDGAGLLLRVADTGIGIPPARIEQLFQPFEQGDVSVARHYGGTGLGLALCRRLTGLMGGGIDVVSEEGKGSAFTVRLPLSVAAGPAAQAAPLRMTEIGVLCTAPQWRAQLLPQLRAWGLEARLIQRPEEWMQSEAPLLLFGSPRPWSVAGEERITARAGRIIDAQENGPRLPVAQRNRILVSCYSIEGLQRALQLAMDPIGPETGGGLRLAGTARVAATERSQPVRVLVVEDHPVNLSLIGDQLQLLGYQASLAGKAADALQLFSEQQYDIVLTDLCMPGVDGYLLARMLRDQRAAVPIVAITAHAWQEDYQRCCSAGIDDILLKPMSLQEIDRMMRRHLGTGKGMPPGWTASRVSRGLSAGLARILRETSEASLKGLRAACAGKRCDAALEHLHAIKGAFAMQRQEQIVMACGELERDCKAGMPANFPVRLEQFEVLIRDALKRIA